MIRRFFILKGAEPDSRLFFWYAGHGHTIKGEGFLVPADAPVGDDSEFKLKALHMRDFGSHVRLAESKHVLAVFDSCFSGTIFSASRGRPPAAITRATNYPVRQFLTSGDADQAVSDDGTFRELFVDSLLGREEADLNRDGYITGSEIGMFLTDRVTNLTRGMQTPRYGKLRDKDYDRGDFVLSVIRPAESELPQPASASPAEPKGIQNERLFWESIRQWDKLQGYQAYLDKYPDGAFAPLARIQLERHGPDEAGPLRPAVTSLAQQRWAATAANVRAEPAVGAARMGGFSQGAPVHVTGEAEVEGQTWYRVQLSGGLEGFVLGRLLVAEAELAAHAGRQPAASRSGAAAEGSNAPHAPPTYTERIEAARRGRFRKRDEQIAEMVQDQAVRSLEQEKCQRSCESTSFRVQVERQSDWPTARSGCEVALPDHRTYDQCVDQQRDQFEQRLRSDCMQNC